MTNSFTEKKRIRNNFGTRESILKEPDLLSIQINSFNNFIQDGETEKKDVGLHSVFKSVFPITALNGYAEIEYLDYELQEPKSNVKECKLRGVTYAATLQVKLNLVLFDKNGSHLKTEIGITSLSNFSMIFLIRLKLFINPFFKSAAKDYFIIWTLNF